MPINVSYAELSYSPDVENPSQGFEFDPDAMYVTPFTVVVFDVMSNSGKSNGTSILTCVSIAASTSSIAVVCPVTVELKPLILAEFVVIPPISIVVPIVFPWFVPKVYTPFDSLTELKASKLAEEKKRKKADEEAKKIANEKKLKAAEEKAKKAAEEKAKKLAEISKKRIDDNIKFVRETIDGMKRLKGLFDAMENKIKKDSRFPDLAKLHKEFYLIVEKPVDEMPYSEITTFINLNCNTET